mmetsp:Transcript_25924/g.59907  ORF Transcript_25924/g.59907 Transcript_25924/m.59907 type:complete len:93 (+) Transcript_25924:117-395(+)
MPPKATKSKVVSSTLPCRYHGSAKGCHAGDTCAFKHDDPLAVAPCKLVNQPGGCKFGDGCFFRHTDLEKPQSKKGSGKGAVSAVADPEPSAT